MSLLQQLQQKADFTNTEIRLADYIIEEQEQLADMTIQHLASHAYCSHTAVIRLSKKLGFKGYKDFKVQLVREIQHHLALVDDVNPNFPFLPDDDYLTIGKKMADLSVNAIQETFLGLQKNLLSAIAREFSKADRLFLYAIGDSQIRAKSFQNKLVKIGQYAILADEHGEDIWHTMNVMTRDLALIVSYGGESKRQLGILRFLKKRKVKTILLTGNKNSQAAETASYVIELPQGEFENIKIGTFLSQMALEYVLDLLFALIYQQHYSRNNIDIRKKEKQIRDFLSEND